MKHIGQFLNTNSYHSQLNSQEWRDYATGVRSERKACGCCRRSDVILQVHHMFYEPDRKLWEYDGQDVILLCKECHQSLHEQLKEFRRHVFRFLNGQTMKVLNGALAVGLTQFDPTVYVHALAEFTGNARLVQNHARAWGMEDGNKTPFVPRGISDLPADYKSEFEPKYPNKPLNP